jgi:pyridoxine kinase
MSHNHQKKIAVINDFSGFGRCSIAVALPIISAMKIQCCPIPTSIFSNHTGFESFVWTDFTDQMQPYMDEWAKLDLKFQAICTGFLGSARQIELVKGFLRRFKTKETLAVIDPVMGDYGKLYPTYAEELALKMVELLPYADILTPNLTEACILTQTPYREDFSLEELEALCERLSSMGPSRVVISGLRISDTRIGNYVWERGKSPLLIPVEKIGTSRSGSGDVFSAIIAADAVNGKPFVSSVQKAANFIRKTIERTVELEIPVTDGLCIEEYLGELSEDC